MIYTLELILVAIIISNIHSSEQTGWLSAYDEESTINQINYGLSTRQIQEGRTVYLATADCKRIGEVGLIQIGDSDWLDYQVFDCAGNDGTPDWMGQNNIIAEIDYYTWQRYGLGRATMRPGAVIQADCQAMAKIIGHSYYECP